MPRRSSHPVLAARVAYLESQAKEARNLAAALNKQNEQLQRENRDARTRIQDDRSG